MNRFSSLKPDTIVAVFDQNKDIIKELLQELNEVVFDSEGTISNNVPNYMGIYLNSRPPSLREPIIVLRAKQVGFMAVMPEDRNRCLIVAEYQKTPFYAYRFISSSYRESDLITYLTLIAKFLTQ